MLHDVSNTNRLTVQNIEITSQINVVQSDDLMIKVAVARDMGVFLALLL